MLSGAKRTYSASRMLRAMVFSPRHSVRRSEPATWSFPQAVATVLAVYSLLYRQLAADCCGWCLVQFHRAAIALPSSEKQGRNSPVRVAMERSQSDVDDCWHRSMAVAQAWHQAPRLDRYRCSCSSNPERFPLGVQHYWSVESLVYQDHAAPNSCRSNWPG